MARLPYLTPDDLPEEHRGLLQRNINLMKLMAHSPGGAKAFSGLGMYIRNRSPLDPRLRELAILQVGYLARAPYEYSHHVKIGRDFGVGDDDIRAMIAETEGRPTSLSPLERAVLACAREMTTDYRASAATFEVLEAHLDRQCLVDLVLTIAFYCAVVRFLATMEIDVEPDYQGYLEAFPLPAGEAR